MFQTLNRLAQHRVRLLTLPALMLMPAFIIGCAPSGPSPAEQARFAEQYLADSAPDGAITVSEVGKLLAPPDPAVASPPATDGQTPATEPPATEPPSTVVGVDGRLQLVLKARLAPPSPDLAAAIPLYPWDDGGAAFYVTEWADHGHAGHDDNCPFCQARKAKAGAMGQLVKVVLINSAGEPLVQDIRPLVKLTGTEALHIVGSARRLPSGLVELEASRLHIDRTARP